MAELLSFDVGVRHLAYCRLLVRPGPVAPGVGLEGVELLDWDIIDLDRVPRVEACAERLMAELHRRFSSLRPSVVLVERQPRARSIIMVAVQMFLCAYFTHARVLADGPGCASPVRFISASRKLAMARGPRPEAGPAAATRRQYAANKAHAVASARWYLEHVLGDHANLALLELYPKKDDLADALLQALAFLEGGSPPPSAGFARRGRRRGRPKSR